MIIRIAPALCTKNSFFSFPCFFAFYMGNNNVVHYLACIFPLLRNSWGFINGVCSYYTTSVCNSCTHISFLFPWNTERLSQSCIAHIKPTATILCIFHSLVFSYNLRRLFFTLIRPCLLTCAQRREKSNVLSMFEQECTVHAFPLLLSPSNQPNWKH